MTNQEMGATFEYHGQRVSFEWQSRQARSRTASASGVTRAIAFIVRAGSVGGFVRAGRASWMASPPPISATVVLRTNRRFIVRSSQLLLPEFPPRRVVDAERIPPLIE